MPAYLCHGFRWHRMSIRVFVVVQDLDDAAPEWIISRRSATAVLSSFYNIFDFLPRLDINRSSSSSNRPTTPKQQRHRQQSSSLSTTASSSSTARTVTTDDVMGQEAWSAVRLLEEYDPTRLDEVSRPYAYVADYVVRIDLSVSIVDEMTRYEERLRASHSSGGSSSKTSAAAGAEPLLPPAMAGPHSDETGRKRPAKEQRKAGWLEKLRDQLQRGEDIKWYVVVNGDEERPWEYGENGRGRGRGESGGGEEEVEEEEEEKDDGLEAEYSRALEARRREQEQREQGRQNQQLPHARQQRSQHHQQQQEQQMQNNATTPRRRPQPRLDDDGARRSADEQRRERERQRLREQFGGLDIDSDPEDPQPLFQGDDARRSAAKQRHERERQRLRQQFGGLDIGSDASRSRLSSSRSRANSSSNRGLPPPPALDPLPPEQQQQQQQQQPHPVHGGSAPKMSMDESPRPPKTPKAGGFRRLFGRGHGHKGSAAESPE